jgi:hypothetical protein
VYIQGISEKVLVISPSSDLSPSSYTKATKDRQGIGMIWTFPGFTSKYPLSLISREGERSFSRKGKEQITKNPFNLLPINFILRDL